jgi:hypothetical protein
LENKAMNFLTFSENLVYSSGIISEDSIYRILNELDNLDEVDIFKNKNNEYIVEVRRVKKVNARGKVRIKMQCKKGFKWTGSACRLITGKEKLVKRLSIRKMVRTKKQGGAGYWRKIDIRTKIAMRKRLMMFPRKYKSND